MVKRARLLLCIAGFGFTVQAEKVKLNVFASRFDSIPIGIVDFKAPRSNEGPPRLPWKIIANDFDLCGRFHVVNRPVFDSASFATEGVGIYIDGEYSVSGNVVTLTCYLNDIAVKERLYMKEYIGDVTSIDRLAHRFSNDVYELLFAEPGIFESRILFITTEAGGKNVAIMDYDGGNRLLITTGKTLNLFPVFADSATMLWTSYLRGKPDIYSGLIKDGKNRLFAASRGIQVSPAVSAIDGSVAFASSKNGSLDIYVCAYDRTGIRQLTVGGGVETAPCWSPNGYQIAYVSDRPGNPNIYIMDAEGANQRRITHKSRYCDSPAWSPNGNWIAFTSMRDDGKLDIWAVSPDGSNEMQLTDFPGHHEYPTWSPDGLLIGFITRSGGKSDFYIMRPDGSEVKQVTSSGNVMMPDWGR
jgi:TolB protein